MVFQKLQVANVSKVRSKIIGAYSAVVSVDTGIRCWNEVQYLVLEDHAGNHYTKIFESDKSFDSSMGKLLRLFRCKQIESLIGKSCWMTVETLQDADGESIPRVSKINP